MKRSYLRPYDKGPGWLNKPKFKHGYYHRLIIYCERCRIKDGLSDHGKLFFGACSYCGRITRCYQYDLWGSFAKTVANRKSTGNGYGRWKRGKAIWLKHSLGRKKK